MGFATRGNSGHATVMRIHNTDWTQRGADLRFLSCYPGEEESLFPPLTYLRCREGQQPGASVTTAGGVVFSVVEIEARQLT